MWPYNPEQRELAEAVRDYILGVTNELSLFPAEDYTPLYCGMRKAMDAKIYLEDGCAARLEEIAKFIVDYSLHTQLHMLVNSRYVQPLKPRAELQGNNVILEAVICYIETGKGAEAASQARQNVIRQALHWLAGTEILEDSEVFVRYQEVNSWLKGAVRSHAKEFQAKIHPKVAPKGGLLQPKALACSGLGTWLFYSDNYDLQKKAQAVCANCDAREACLELALENNEKFGIWGGKSERERRRLRRKRRLEQKQETDQSEAITA